MLLFTWLHKSNSQVYHVSLRIPCTTATCMNISEHSGLNGLINAFASSKKIIYPGVLTLSIFKRKK